MRHLPAMHWRVTPTAGNTQPGYLEQHLRVLLRRGGCPICAEYGADESSYFSWFVIETYAIPEVLSEFRSALGFCPRHGNRLTRHFSCTDQISFLHGHAGWRVLKLVKSCADHDKQQQLALLASPGPCPACASLRAGEQRNLFFLEKFLSEPSGFDSYGQPGMLCFLHLQTASRRWSPEILKRMIAVHESAMESVSKKIETTLSASGRSHSRDELVKAIDTSLHLTVGRSMGPTMLPAPETSSQKGARDPVNDFVANMQQETDCPVCLEVTRAWRDWVAWLEDAAKTSQSIEGLLPTCREHAWGCAELGGLRLGLAVAKNALRLTLGQLRNAKKNYAVRERGKGESTLGYAWRLFLDSRERTGRVRQIMSSEVSCPLCRRLAEARDTALRLLFALLEEQRYRTAFEAGYGLCLKHFSRALALQPRKQTRMVLVEVELAKLALLQWELEEYSRKARWDARPEQSGTEGTAWKRAINRFSGCL